MFSTKKAVEAARLDLVAKYGEWTAHDISLGHDTTTMGKGLYQQWRVDYLRSLIEAYAHQQPAASSQQPAASSQQPAASRRRLLDLACLEGLFAIEFARIGFDTLGIEIREAHLAKAQFAASANSLVNCSFQQDDVRNLSKRKHGEFDVVLCAGILYHLDFPDCVRLIHSICEVCRDVVVIDTHVATDSRESSVLPLGPMQEFIDRHARYRGRQVVEHVPDVSAEAKRTEHPWASIDNDRSVWLTEESIVAALKEGGFEVCHAGFPSTQFKCNNPDRLTIVARRRN